MSSVLLPKLTIELVPKTCWYSNVRSNVPPAHWDIIRKQAYALANYVCEICGMIGTKHPVECHEVWHYDDHTHIQKLTRMTALCPSCHYVKHIGRASEFGYLKMALEHLSMINGWDIETSKSYVFYQFDKWNIRSKYNWKLDISVLSNYTKSKINAW